MAEKDSVIVAIEFGSSRIAAIAGKVKDGTMQIVAYAEDTTCDCVKRGVVYNIEKTTQSIKKIIARLESALKLKVARVYVGIGGQSVRSVTNVIRRNMLTATYINQSHIDSITDESHEVKVEDYELIGYFPQNFIVDANAVADPVGVMGTNIEGEFLNVIANKRLKNNINTCFDNTDIEILDYRLSSYELAVNVLNDTEKRSGCALVDMGAGTTTIVIFKNNVVRRLVTVPLGVNNIKQDLCSLQIDEKEADTLLMRYGNAVYDEDIPTDPDTVPMYTTSDGRDIPVDEIQHIIVARINEILTNVKSQISQSQYAGQLLGGIIITGGGSCVKNMEKACMKTLKMEKVRTAHKVIPQLIKNSVITNLALENNMSNTIVSLLLSGNESCVGDNLREPDMFARKEVEDSIASRRLTSEETRKNEEDAVAELESIKSRLRDAILSIEKLSKEIEEDPANKRLRAKVDDVVTEAGQITGNNYDNCKFQLENKDKYKQAIREAEELMAKRDDMIDELHETAKEASKQDGIFNKITNWIGGFINE